MNRTYLTCPGIPEITCVMNMGEVAARLLSVLYMDDSLEKRMDHLLVRKRVALFGGPCIILR